MISSRFKLHAPNRCRHHSQSPAVSVFAKGRTLTACHHPLSFARADLDLFPLGCPLGCNDVEQWGEGLPHGFDVVLFVGFEFVEDAEKADPGEFWHLLKRPGTVGAAHDNDYITASPWHFLGRLIGHNFRDDLVAVVLATIHPKGALLQTPHPPLAPEGKGGIRLLIGHAPLRL